MDISATWSDYTGYGVSCNGASDGFIDVTVTGGTGVYTYAWSNGSTSEDLADVSAGIYSVVATDENGCSISIEVELSEADAIQIDVDLITEGPHFNGDTSEGFGSIDLTVWGCNPNESYSYDWTCLLYTSPSPRD